jgi:hypothetical protein
VFGDNCTIGSTEPHSPNVVEVLAMFVMNDEKSVSILKSDKLFDIIVFAEGSNFLDKVNILIVMIWLCRPKRLSETFASLKRGGKGLFVCRDDSCLEIVVLFYYLKKRCIINGVLFP